MLGFFRGYIGCSAACASLIALVWAGPARGAAPVPIGTSHIEVSYETTGGPVAFSGDRGYQSTNPFVPTNLGGAPNIGLFNSSDVFAWRNRVGEFHPNVIKGNEVVISHAFFKITPSNQPGNGSEFFPGLVEDGSITLTVTDIHFDQPVYVAAGTFLVHTLWDLDQVDQLDNPYHHEHNCHSADDPFRDFDDFFSPVAAFASHPEPNYTLGAVSPMITGQGTDTLNITLTLPYAMLQHLSDMDQGAPAGLPAPQGFLEPFHIHFEYAVAGAAEPAVATAVSRKSNSMGPGGLCDLPLLPSRKSEPRAAGISEVRVGFNAPPGTPSGSGVTLEQATCAAPAFAPYNGSSVVSGSLTGNLLALSFSPALENGRTYRINFDPQVTTLAGQSIEVRALAGDVNGDGRANATDRSSVVNIWTSTNFSCGTDLDGNGRTHGADRSLVVGAWTGAQNCAP